jgi:Ca-activated chloride channel family protein
VFSLQLTLQDDLAVDNQASIVSRMPQPVKILLVTRGNRFLEKALRSGPQAEVTVLPSLTDDARAFDMVILDDVAPIVWPAIHTLAIHTADPAWFDNLGTVKGPPVVDWKSTHPLLRFVNFDNVQIAEALSVKPPSWGIPLVESPETPLIVAGELDKRRVVWVAFDVLNSTWPLRISFPIFIANAVEWLNPANINAAQVLIRAGQPFHLNLLQAVSSASVITPAGETRPLPIEKDTREIIFGETGRQGVYRLQAGTNDMAFCVNLLDAAESTIAPRNTLSFGKYEVVEAAALKQANLEIWRWFAAAALVVLLFEWWFYHKRTV